MHRTTANKLDHHAVIFTVIFLLAAAARLDAAAVRIGTEFLVNTNTVGTQSYSSDRGQRQAAASSSPGATSPVGMAPAGVCSLGVSTRSATAIGDEFQVNSYTSGAQDLPSVSVATNGSFVIAWVGYGGQDGSDNGIFARRFNAAGVAEATEFQVNSYTQGPQLTVSLAVEGNGDFVVAWTSFQIAEDGSGDGIFAQRFDAAGGAPCRRVPGQRVHPGAARRSPASTPTRTATSWWSGSATGRTDRCEEFSAGASTPPERLPASSFRSIRTRRPIRASAAYHSTPNGDFVVVWQSTFPRSLSSPNVSAPLGSLSAAEFQVDVDGFYVAVPRCTVGLARLLTADFVIAWSGSGGDGSGRAACAHRQFHASGIPLDDRAPG